MFDELIIPAARLLDTVETKLKDVRLANVTNRSKTETTGNATTQAIQHPTTDIGIHKRHSPQPLCDYKTAVYEESELIEWGNNTHFQDHQIKQVSAECTYPVGRRGGGNRRGDDRLWTENRKQKCPNRHSLHQEPRLVSSVSDGTLQTVYSTSRGSEQT